MLGGRLVKNRRREVLQLATRAGKMMLENGGEVYRVEDTVQRICREYGVEECECFATPTAIIASVIGDDEQVYTRVRRISSRTVNITKIERINTFSRLLNQDLPDIKKGHEILSDIDKEEGYPAWVRVLAAGIGTGTFTVLFGGDIISFLCGLIIGMLVRGMMHFAAKKEVKNISIHIFAGILCVFLSWLAYITPLAPNWQQLSLSALMFMTPGMMFVNALRDTASGELIAGISSITEVIMISAALAFGSLLVYVPIVALGGGTF